MSSLLVLNTEKVVSMNCIETHNTQIIYNMAFIIYNII